MGENNSWGSEGYSWRKGTYSWGNDTYSWGNDTYSWGNDTYSWGNDTYSWGNESYPWGNESYPCGNYSGNWLAGYSNFSFNVRLPLSIVFGLAQLVGILGNLLVIIATVQERRLQNNYYLLLMNLAACDLVLLLLNAFDTAIFLWFPDVTLLYLTFVACKIWYPLQECIFILEGQILILLAALRLRAVQAFKRALTRKTVKWLLLLQYILAVMWTIPFAVGSKIEYGICWINWFFGDDYFGYLVVLRVYETLVPTTLLIVLYSKICRQLISLQRNAKELFSTTAQSSNPAQPQTSTATTFQSGRQARNSRVVVTSIIITVLYVFGTVVIQIGGVLNKHVHKINYEQFMWTTWVYYVCVASANPVIYGFRDKSLLLGYKRSLANIASLFKLKKKRSVAVSS